MSTGQCAPIYFEGSFPTELDYFKAGHSMDFDPTTNSLLVFGGYKGPQHLHLVKEANDLGSKSLKWQTVNIGGKCRAAHLSFMMDSKLYLHAGYDANTSQVFSDLVEIDIKSGQIESKLMKYKSVIQNVERRWHCGFVKNRKLFIHGGWNAGGSVCNTLCLDLATMVWNQVELSGTAPSPRRWHTLTQISDNQYLIFGGYNGDHKKPLGDLHIMDLGADKWIELESKGQVN